MLKRILLLLVLFLVINLQAQQLEISGQSNQSGALIRLIEYKDMLNFHGETIIETHADEKGGFQIQTEISQIGVFELAIDLERIMLVLKPGARYDFTIQIDKDQQNNSYFDKSPPALIINKADDDGLQLQLESIDRLVNNFALDHFKELYQLRRYSLLDTLSQQLKDVLSTEDSDYAKTYARYKFAALEMAVKRNGGRQIIAEYFAGKPIYFHLEPYMSLFKEIFKDYLLHSRSVNTTELLAMQPGDYNSWRELLRGDTLLSKDTELADLIIIQSLKDFYYNPRFNRVAVRNYLEVHSAKAKNQNLQRLASNALVEFDRLAAGTKAPDFMLPDAAGKTKQISDYKGSSVMFVFVNESCPVCELLFQNLEEMQEAFEKKFRIVVLAWEQKPYYANYIRGMGFEWEVLTISREKILLLEDYNIRTFPELVLVDQNGNIGMAPLPSEEIALKYHLNRLLNNY
ncbi:MAG: redoxin domain-containing protein [Bacteroidales bacterium]|nr:redoxin domain-containing protein [Bacteroidales bacterium]